MAICRVPPLPLDGSSKKNGCKCQQSDLITPVRNTKTVTKLPKNDIPYTSTGTEEASPKTLEKTGRKRSSPPKELENRTSKDFEKRHSNANHPSSDLEKQQDSLHSKGRTSKSSQSPSTEINRQQESQAKISKSPVRNRRRIGSVAAEKDDGSGSKPCTKLFKNQEVQVSSVKADKNETIEPKKSAPKKKQAPDIPVENKNGVSNANKELDQQIEQSKDDNLTKRFLNKWRKSRSFTKSKPTVIEKSDSPKESGDPEPILNSEKSNRDNKPKPVQISIVQVRKETEDKLIEEIRKVQTGGHGGNVNTIIVPAMSPPGLPPNGGNLQGLHELIRIEARSCNRGLEEILNEVIKLKRDVHELREMCAIFLKLSKENVHITNNSIGKQNGIRSISSDYCQPTNEGKSRKKKCWKKFLKFQKPKAAKLENGKG